MNFPVRMKLSNTHSERKIHMSHNDCIRTALNLKDKNIIFNEKFCEEKKMKGLKSVVYYATLTYRPNHCRQCGVKNECFKIVKNGFLTSKIKWLSTSHQPTYICLKKQRFLCRECQGTFVATSPEIESGCFIATRVKQSIAIELGDAISLKDLSRRHGVSPTTTSRVLTQLGKDYQTNFNYLPEHLCFDEFNSVKGVEGKMSFIYCDSVSHKIIDILPNRRQDTVSAHFSRYSLEARNNVKTIVVDMNAAYFSIAYELFPNAKVIIDRFHIIQLISRSLNQTRIQVMKQYFTSNNEDRKNYRKLKRYWRLMLKCSAELDYQNYHYQRLFKKPMPETDIMDYILSLDSTLKATYEMYQDLLYYSKHNDFDGFKQAVTSMKPEVSSQMHTSIKTLKKHLSRIKNTFKYSYSNGPLEGINNKIKVIKRVAYGYRSFWNFKHRILVSFKIQKNSSTILGEAA